MKKLKYFLITTEFPPYYGGGISTYCKHTVEMLKDHYDVTVFVLNESLETDRKIEKRDGFTVVQFLPKQFHALVSFSSLAMNYCDEVLSYIDKHGTPDIIESQEFRGIAYFLIHKKRELDPRLADAKIVMATHNPIFHVNEIEEAPMYQLPEYWNHYLEKYTLINADAVIYISEAVKSAINSRLTVPTYSTIIFNPFQAKITPISSHFEEEITFIGRLQRTKGIDQLFDMLDKYFWSQGSKVKLHLIGDTNIFIAKQIPWIDYLRKKYAKYFSEGLIIYHGKMKPEDMHRVASNSKAVVMPSRTEGFPYVACEQLAAGKVMLVSDTGGQAEIIQDGKSGFIYHSPEEFKQKLDHILSLDDKKLVSLGKAAQARISELSGYEHVFKAKDKFLRELVDHKTKPVYNFVFEHEPGFKPFSEPKYSKRKTVKGRLSVIIPYFNLGAYVEETVDSVFSSKYPDKEIILVNDGSTEQDSIDKIHELKVKYPELIIINKPNGGICTTRNEGYEHATGEFIATLDADDMVVPEFFDRAIEVMKTYANISFVSPWVQGFGAWHELWVGWDSELPYMLYHNLMAAGCVVYRASALYAAGYTDEAMVYGIEDYEALLNLMEHGHKGIPVTEPYQQYRVLDQSRTKAIRYASISNMTEVITRKHAKLYSLYGPELYNLSAQNGSGLIIASPASVPSSHWQIEQVFGTISPEASTRARKIVKTVLRRTHLLPVAKKVRDQLKHLR